MADTTYSAYCTKKWVPSGSSYTKQYRARIDTTLSNQPTYCQISYTGYINLTSSVSHTHNWSRGGTGISGSGTVKTVVGEDKTVKCCSGSSSQVKKTHSAQTISASLTIWSSSSGGSNTWNGQKVTATKTYTVPALASYPVTYNTNGGTGTVSGTKWYSETYYISNGAALSKDGYTLLKWNTQPDGSGTDYIFGQAYTANTSLTLYAIWQENPSCTVEVNSSAPYYTGKQGYSVSISDIVTHGEATLGSIVLTLGEQAEIWDDDDIVITPSTAGNFTPVVTITDSLGASVTYQLPEITVKQYIAPDAIFSIERTLNTGQTDEASGQNAVITARFIFCDDGYYLIPPTVVYGATTASVTWYTARDNIGRVDPSDAINWNNNSIQTGDTIYGLISDVFLINASYDISLTPSDNRTYGVTKTQTLSAAIFPVDFYAGGGGVSIGRMADNDGLFCNMPATFENDIILSLDDTTASGTDYDILQALTVLDWDVDPDPDIVIMS